MKKQKKLTWIGLMMVLSQIMLMVFVVQWLLMQFRVEKEQLVNDLKQQFTEARQQVMDSMLVYKVISPILGDSLQCNIRIDIRNDSTLQDNGNKKHKIESFVRKYTTLKAGFVALSTCDSGSSLPLQMPNGDKSVLYSDNTVLNGVKLIIADKNDLQNDTRIFDNAFSFTPDSSLFKKIFGEKLAKQGFNFSPIWVSGHAHGKDSIAPKHKAIYFESGIFDSQFGPEISHYNLYLFKKISPQAIFALILLILSGAAFYIAYRNLKNQMMLNTLRNEFVGNVSHELKTPVATVKVALEALRNFDMKKDPAITNDYLEMASLEMNRLELLINKVLNTSILEEGSQLIYPETTDLKLLTEEVLKSLQLRFANENATLHFEAGEGNFTANLDRLYIQGVIINLLDNSLKYGGEKVSIRVKLEQDRQKILLSVSDNGPGIPEQFSGKIFDKFFRVPTGDRHNVKGYGLGLSFVALVMKHHKGTVEVRNLKEGGCEFVLSFPKIQ